MGRGELLCDVRASEAESGVEFTALLERLWLPAGRFQVSLPIRREEVRHLTIDISADGSTACYDSENFCDDWGCTSSEKYTGCVGGIPVWTVATSWS